MQIRWAMQIGLVAPMTPALTVGTMSHFRMTTKEVVLYRYISIYYYYDSGHFQVAFGMGSQGL